MAEEGEAVHARQPEDIKVLEDRLEEAYIKYSRASDEADEFSIAYEQIPATQSRTAEKKNAQHALEVAEEKLAVIARQLQRRQDAIDFARRRNHLINEKELDRKQAAPAAQTIPRLVKYPPFKTFQADHTQDPVRYLDNMELVLISTRCLELN